MKKALFVLMALLLATPAMAVTLKATQTAGTYDVVIGYEGNSQNAMPDKDRARAFALKISVDAGTITAVSADAANGNGLKYGIYPSNISIDGTTGAVNSYGSPLAPDNEKGIGGASAIGGNQVIIAMGSLYKGDANKPGAAGNLVKVTVSGACNLTVAPETTVRGGVVGEDANTMNVNPVTIPVTALVTETITTPTLTQATNSGWCNSGRTESFTAAATSSVGHTLEYQFTWGDGVVGSWGAATQTHVYTYSAAATYNVTVQARCAADTAVVSTASTALAVKTEPYKTTAPGYSYWVTFGRPNCWAFQKQCNGDAEGTKELTKPVMNKDLAVLSAAYNKTDAQLQAAPLVNGVPPICADFTHSAELGKKVLNADLLALSNYYNKADTSVPQCSSANVHYFTN